MQKTIAIVTNSTWNIHNFRLGLIKRLKAEGYKVLVIAPVDEYIHYLNESYFTKHIPLKSLSPQSKNPFKDILLIWELFKIYKKEQPDLILHYTIKPNIFGSIAAKMAKRASISTVTGLGYTFLSYSFTNKVVKRLYRFAFEKIQKIIFHNPDDQKLFIDEKIIEKNKSIVIPGSGVNTNYFRPLAIQPNREKFVFLFIGRLLYDKGIIEFVEAAKQLKAKIPQAEFWVIGQAEAKNPSIVSKKDLLKWVEAHYIRYMGPTKDVRKVIRKVDAVVLPSYREGMPRAILEGMAMGKPIITTDTPGCKATVQGNGFLVPAKNVNALADAMLRLYRIDEIDYQLMSQKSRQMALDVFDEKLIIEHYFDIIKSLIPDHYPLPATKCSVK
jgi:glycosyltransferase involved in cell wall biosynthesis